MFRERESAVKDMYPPVEISFPVFLFLEESIFDFKVKYIKIKIYW